MSVPVIPESLANAVVSALDDALDLATCQGDTRNHPPRPVWETRPDAPDDYDTWIEYAARAAIAVVLSRLVRVGWYSPDTGPSSLKGWLHHIEMRGDEPVFRLPRKTTT